MYVDVEPYGCGELTGSLVEPHAALVGGGAVVSGCSREADSLSTGPGVHCLTSSMS